MKVVLKKDVARIGRQHEVKEVPDGLARNRLIPQGLVVAATPKNIADAQKAQKRRTDTREAGDTAFEKAVDALKDATLTIKAAANEGGNLFKGIHKEDIAQRIREEVGQFNAEDVELKDPIKTVGTHEVALHHGSKKGAVTLEVLAQ